jgi:type IV secretory pathway VirJ component
VDKVCSAATTQQFVAATGASRVYSLPKVGHGFGVQGGWVPQLLDALHAIGDAHAARLTPRASAPAVADLSLVEVPASAGSGRDEFAIVLTGDGGWADIDKSIAAGLAAAGIPVVGWSSLDYYWTPRTPGAAAADLARIVEHYASTWGKARVRVIGYSFGADVAPFLVNRLPAGTRSRVADVALLGPSGTAAFAFHFASWFGGGADPTLPTLPEIKKLGTPVTCIYAADEGDSVCRDVRAPGRVEAIGHGHHFGGEYERLVELMLR